MKTLRVADGVRLPVDFVTKTTAICAQRRKGKTYCASVLAEELYDARLPWVALDPTGAWWGLRASADGRDAGLPVIVLGGQHGDVPLDRGSGRFVADLVIESPGWYVLDLSLFESKAAEREFSADFAEALYRRKGQPDRDFTMHLFVDEADMFVPQDRDTGDARMLGAFQSIVRRGGLRGLGTTLISQRPALVNKSVFTQLDMLILLRIVAGNDQDYLDKNYISRNADKDQRAAMMESLASLKLGEAWLYEPGAEPPMFVRAQIRERHTFNSSATPKPGEQRIEPRRLADVDLDAVKVAMADAIERARADDPKELHRRIRELERQLAERPAAESVEVEIPVEIPTPVIDESLVIRIEEALSPVVALCAEIQERLTWETTTRDEAIEFKRRLADRRADLPGARESGDGARRGPRSEAAERPDPPRRREPGRPTAPRAAASDGAIRLGRRERRILSVLYQYPSGRSEDQLAFLTQYSASASTIGAGLSILRKAGLVESGAPPRLTPEGVAHAETIGVEPLPTGPDLLAYWRTRLGKRERAFLDHLVSIYPDPTNHDELAEVTGYSREASTIGAGMSVLRKLEIADGWRASDDFMDAIR